MAISLWEHPCGHADTSAYAVGCTSEPLESGAQGRGLSYIVREWDCLGIVPKGFHKLYAKYIFFYLEEIHLTSKNIFLALEKCHLNNFLTCFTNLKK